MQAKRSKQGFTLVEIIVSLVIVGIVGVFLAGFLSPQIRMYDAATAQTQAKTVCAGIFNLVQKQVRWGKDFVLDGNRLTYTAVTAAEADLPNQLLNGDTLGNELYPDYLKAGKTIVTSFVQTEGLLEITVQIQQVKDGKVLYEAVQTINCLNEVIARQPVPTSP